MNTITKLLIGVIAITWMLQGVADNHGSGGGHKLAIHHIHVKMGHGMKFRAGMEAFAACLAENGAEDGYSVWQAIDGDRTSFHIVSQFDMWAEMDEDDEVGDDCWQKEGMRAGIFDHMSSWETNYAKRLPDWSGDADGYTIVKLHNFRVDDSDVFRKLVGEIVGYMKEAKYEHLGTWYQMMTGGYKDADFFVVEHYANYAAMDEKRKGADGILRDAVGDEKADEMWDSFGEALEDQKGYWSNLLSRQDSLGYSPEDD